jgi:putative ABC transport system ATP-binding protein
MPILDLQGITKEYRKGERMVQALRGVDLRIDSGEFTAIVGPSGSGKTTLLNIIGCLDSATGGRVDYNGTQLVGMDEKQLSEYRKHNIAFIFQSYNLIPVLSVRENVELPLDIEGTISKRDMADKAMEIIRLVGLGEMPDRLPRELSGGQEQRVAIARALVKNPLVVLADEPTANLDSHTAQEILDVMEKLNRERGMTFVFSTHDRMVQERARRVVVLKDGMVASDDKKEPTLCSSK